MKRQIKIIIKSDPIELAFKKSGTFCFANWRDPHCMKLRDLLYEILHYGDKEIYQSKNIKVKHFWHTDQNYYFIDDKYNNFYYIATWYKSRGKTDCILFQGTIITLSQMNYLLKTLTKERNKVKKNGNM